MSDGSIGRFFESERKVRKLGHLYLQSDLRSHAEHTNRQLFLAAIQELWQQINPTQAAINPENVLALGAWSLVMDELGHLFSLLGTYASNRELTKTVIERLSSAVERFQSEMEATPVPAKPEGEGSQNPPESTRNQTTPTDEMFRAYVACKLLTGITQTEIGLELGICQGTVSKHKRKVQGWIDAGNTLPDIWSQPTNARPRVFKVNPHKLARRTPAHGDDGTDFDEE
jgi:hypothetical protein